MGHKSYMGYMNLNRPEAIDNRYVDPISGKIEIPRSSMDASKRRDAAMRMRAFENETKKLNETGYFQNKLSMDEYRSMEYTQVSIPQMVFYEANYDSEEKFIDMY
jgi:hypothetical protein